MKPNYWASAIIFIAIVSGLIFFNSCSKMNPAEPAGNETENYIPPDTTYACPEDTMAAEKKSLLAVYSTEADGSPLSNVCVYTKEGVPAELKPWPTAGRNLTPVEFNQVEPGSYTIIGIKAGYDTSVTSVIIEAGKSETAYLVMHKIQQTPIVQQSWVKFTPLNPYDMDVILNGVSLGSSQDVHKCLKGVNNASARRVGYQDSTFTFCGVLGDTVIVPITLISIPQPYFAIHFDGLKILKFKGTVFEECQNDTLVLNGPEGEGPLVKIAVKNLEMECSTWYKVDISQYQYKYTRITFIYGNIWHYHTLSIVECQENKFELVKVRTERPNNDQWFTLVYN